MPKFKGTTEEIILISKIVKRANYYGKEALNLTMDLEAVHSNGTPLDFAKLLASSLEDFAHDIYGIKNNVDRSTGKLLDCFMPRCAK
jgi:hypothetical protein